MIQILSLANCVELLCLVCYFFGSSAIYTGEPRTVFPAYSSGAGCHAAYSKGYRANCVDQLQLKVGGAMGTTGENAKAKEVVKYGVLSMNRIREYFVVHGVAARFDVYFRPLADRAIGTATMTNKTACGVMPYPCISWLITPFGEEHTIEVVKKIVGNIFNSFAFIWSTSNDVVYDNHCSGKGCWGLLPTWEKYLNGPLDTTTTKCRASYSCASAFKAAMVTDGKAMTEKISVPSKDYLKTFNISLMSITVAGQSSVNSVVAELQKKMPDLVIIGASGDEIGYVVEGIANTKYRPSAIVAVNTKSSVSEGGNMMNAVLASQFPSAGAKYMQCVAFPIYYDPNAPWIDCTHHIAPNAKSLGEVMQGNVTKFTAHLFQSLGWAYQGTVNGRLAKTISYSFRTEASIMCKPYPTPSVADIASKTAFPLTKTCRGLTYMYNLDYTTGKPLREMLMSQQVGASVIRGLATAAGEHVSGRKPLGTYTTVTKTIFHPMFNVIQGTHYIQRDLTYDDRPMHTDLISNPFCGNWNIFTTTTTTTTSTVKISGSQALRTGTACACILFSVILRIVSS